MNDYGMDIGTFASDMMYYEDQDRAVIEYYWDEFIEKEFARFKAVQDHGRYQVGFGPSRISLRP